MPKSIRKYALIIKRHKAAVVGLLVVVLFVLFQVFPTFAAEVQGVVIRGIPNFGNSPPTVTTIASSGYMDGTGTHATLTGSMDDFSIFADADIWFEWGYNGSYDNTIGFQNVSKLDTYTQDIDGFNPTEPVNFRIVGENLDGKTYGDGLVLQMQENAVLGSYRVVAVTPLAFTALIIVGLVGIMKVGLSVGGLIFGAILVYAGSAFLEGIQGSLRLMWGG